MAVGEANRGDEAFRWTAETGMVDLGSHGNSSRADIAYADGSVIFGWDERPQFGNRRAAVGVDGVKTVLEDSDWPSEASAVGADGSTLAALVQNRETGARLPAPAPCPHARPPPPNRPTSPRRWTRAASSRWPRRCAPAWRRCCASTPVRLFSLNLGPDDGDAPPLLPLGTDAPGHSIEDYLVSPAAPALEGSIEVVRNGTLTTFVVPAGPTVAMPTRLSTGWRIVRALPAEPPGAWMRLRNYMLHTPCRTLVRDLFIDPALWPDAQPQLDFYLPGPSGTPIVEVEPGRPHLRRLNLTARIEPLPAGAAGLELEGASDHAGVLQAALARAHVDPARLRGWRCRMAYPLPLVEMLLTLRFAGR